MINFRETIGSLFARYFHFDLFSRGAGGPERMAARERENDRKVSEMRVSHDDPMIRDLGTQRSNPSLDRKILDRLNRTASDPRATTRDRLQANLILKDLAERVIRNNRRDASLIETIKSHSLRIVGDTMRNHNVRDVATRCGGTITGDPEKGLKSLGDLSTFELWMAMTYGSGELEALVQSSELNVIQKFDTVYSETLEDKGFSYSDRIGYARKDTIHTYLDRDIEAIEQGFRRKQGEEKARQDYALKNPKLGEDAPFFHDIERQIAGGNVVIRS
jgi:hypothetical protein